MASYEEVMTALRNAHDAGDTEAATRLAGIASGLKGTSSTQQEPQVPAGDGEGFLDKAIGLGQAAASTITGGIGAATGWIPAAIQKANDPSNVNFEQQYAANMGAMTYEPSREKGQEYAGKVGGFVNDVLLPAATGVQGLPYANTAAPLLGAIGRNLGKFGKAKEATISPAKSLAEALKKEDEVPVAKPVEPNMEFYKQEALRKQQEAQSKPITVDEQGVARTAEQEKLQPQTPSDYTPNEGLNGQRALFDYSEEGRMPNPYEAVPGDWRVDENGMPIKADLSMDVANAENPLQRNLWGDELAQKHPQENELNIPQAIDSLPDLPWKDQREEALSRLQGELPATGELQGAVEASRRAAEGVPEPLPPLGSKARQALMKKQGGGLLMDWGSAKKAEGFSSIPGIKESLRDIGNALIKTPEQAIEFAKQTSDVAQNAVQKAFNNLTKGGAYLKGRINDPVFHYGVDRLLGADGLAKADINQKLGKQYLTDLRDLSKQEYMDAMELLNVADLTQKTITPEMMQQHGLSPKLQKFLTTHNELMADALANINRVRAAADKEPITARRAYSAMSMNGDYRKVAYLLDENGKRVKDPKTNTDVVVGAIAADRLKGKLGWTLEKIEKHVKDKMPNVEFGELRDTTITRGSAKGTPHEAFTDALRTLGENNPHVAELLKVLDEVAKDDASNYMGMQKHTMQKKGIWGMEGRKPWETAENNATQFFENQVKYLEGVYNWTHLAEAAKDVNSVIRNPDVMKKHPNAVRLTEDYMMNALGLNPTRLGRALTDTVNAIGAIVGGYPAGVQKGFGLAKKAANISMLSLNESFLLIQALQAPTGIPAAVALLRSRGLASKWTGLTLGLDHFVEAGGTLLKDQAGLKVSDIDRGAIEYAKKNHIYATDMVEHNSNTQKTTGYYLSKAAHSPAAVIETGTRAQAYLTFVKVLEDGGMKVKDGLYEQAHHMTNEVMNNMSAMEKPPVYNALGPIGSMAYNLKSFGHNELSRWAQYAREIGDAKGIGGKANASQALLTQMATTIAVAGAFGLPLYSQFETLYNYITKKLGNPRSLTLDVIKTSEQLAEKLGPDGYEKFKNAMSHGLFSTLGADVSKRIGLGDVLPSKASDAAFAGGGKLADMGKTAIGAAMNPDEQHLKAAAVAWSPNVLAGPLKEKWYTDEKGVYSMDPDKKRELITEINGTDRLLKKVGVTGINESVRKTKDYQLKQIEKAYQDIRDSALVNISHDMSSGKGISPESIDKYFTNGQGDPSSFENSINDIGMKLNIPRDTLALMKGAASSSVQRALATQRRVQAQ